MSNSVVLWMLQDDFVCEEVDERLLVGEARGE
jgi:hypothetical protein